MSRKMKVDSPPAAAPVLEAPEPAPSTIVVTDQLPPRRARHYLQRFDEVQEMVWAKHCTCFGLPVRPGDPVNRSLFRIDKLRRLWDAGFVQAKEWDAATARRTRTSRRRRIA